MYEFGDRELLCVTRRARALFPPRDALLGHTERSGEVALTRESDSAAGVLEVAAPLGEVLVHTSRVSHGISRVNTSTVFSWDYRPVVTGTQEKCER